MKKKLNILLTTSILTLSATQLFAVLVIGGIFFVGLVDSQSYTPYSKVGLSLYLLDSDGGENPGRRYQDHDRDYVSYKS